MLFESFVTCNLVKERAGLKVFEGPLRADIFCEISPVLSVRLIDTKQNQI